MFSLLLILLIISSLLMFFRPLLVGICRALVLVVRPRKPRQRR
jgi:hypothetical protein